MFAKLQFMTFLYQTIMKMMIILMTQKPPFSKLLRRKNAFKGIFNSWITHAIFALTYGIVVFAQFSRRRWMLETMNTKFTKKEKFPKLPSIGGLIWKCAMSTAKQSLDMELLSEKRYHFVLRGASFDLAEGCSFFTS